MGVFGIKMARPAFIKLFLLFLILVIIASCSTLGESGPDGYILRRSSKQKPAEPEEPKPTSSTETVASETIGKTVSPGRQDPPAGGNIAGEKTASGVIFTGVVTGIDTARKTISMKTTGKDMTFDLANPVVRGYKDVNEIKTGDTVTLGYIRNGIGIVKGENFHEDLRQQAAPDEQVPLRSGKKGSKNQSKRAAPIKVKYRVNSMSFKDIDNNKDGRVSPVELGAVIPNLSMENYKKYDRNGDGGLDESEYRNVRKR